MTLSMSSSEVSKEKQQVNMVSNNGEYFEPSQNIGSAYDLYYL